LNRLSGENDHRIFWTQQGWPAVVEDHRPVPPSDVKFDWPEELRVALGGTAGDVRDCRPVEMIERCHDVDLVLVRKIIDLQAQ
jgi:hypothetical protein